MSDLPAIIGGTPIRPQGPPEWPNRDNDVLAAMQAAWNSGDWGKYDGELVKRLEESIRRLIQVPFAATCASGTLAVEIALRAMKVGAGDEVVLAAYDYEPNFLNIHHVGALPVLVDVDRADWQIDLNRLDDAITPKTRAILVTHLHGGLVDMNAVMKLAEHRGIRVIEDAAQATGAMIQGRSAGAWGDVAILSFGGSKLLTAGRGGAVLTRHAELHQRVRLELRRGIQQWAALSELQAAALLPQLAKLPERNQRRRDAVLWLVQRLRDIAGLRLFELRNEGAAAYYKVGFQFDASRFGLSRHRFVAAVRAEGIAIDAGFRALQIGRASSRFRAVGGLPNAAAAHECCILLHHPVLLENEVALQQVAHAIHKVYSNAERLSELPDESAAERAPS